MNDLKLQLRAVYVCLCAMLVSTVLSQLGIVNWHWQESPVFRNWTGALLFTSLLGQWCLSIGRVVYQRQGARWDAWVEVHQALAWAVPFLALLHSLQLGYGLLGALPLVLFAAATFGLWISLRKNGRRWLPYHLVFSALTLAGSVVHLLRVVFYR